MIKTLPLGWQAKVVQLFRRILGKRAGVDSQLDCLDGLRGVAVMFVILSHFSGFGMYIIPGINFMGTGKMGVWLFFILSSFLLTSKLLHRVDRIMTGRVWADYAMRRILRIMPLYSVVLFTSYCFSMTEYFEPLDFKAVMRHLAMLAGDGVFWTIPVEFKFYLVLPLVTLFCVRVLRMRWWAVSVFFVTVILAFVIWPLPSVRYGLGRYITVFLTGMFTAFLDYYLVRSGCQLSKVTRTAAELIGWAIAIYFVMLTPDILSRLIDAPVSIKTFFSYFTRLGILWAIFLMCVIHGCGWLNRILSCSALRMLGILSFGMYLWHMPICNIVNECLNIPNTGKAYVALFSVFLVALLSHILVERPLMQLRLPNKRKGA